MTNKPSLANIRPISRTRLGSVRRLTRKQGRAAADQFLVDGVQSVREALRYGGAELLLVSEPLLNAYEQLEPASEPPATLNGLIDVLTTAQQRDIEVASVSIAEDRQLSDTVTSQGVFAVCPRRHPVLSAVTTAQLVVICAEVRDPGNAGTIIRAADAFGAAAVVFTNGSVEVENGKTVRASVGSLFHLPVIQGIDFDTAVTWAKDNAMQVLAADAGGRDLTDIPLQPPTAWVFGNEAWGFTPEVLASVDQVASVPMFGKAESLNVAAAAAICLFATATAQRPQVTP